MQDRLKQLYRWLFAEERREMVEKFFLFLAIGGFFIHLLIIILVDFNLVDVRSREDSLLNNVISAIYTPFSFILIYEVLLLVYYLPNSFSTSIAKQYEIISLIILRRIFKDIAKLDVESRDWSDIYHVNLLVDMVGVLFLILLIYLFYRLILKRPETTAPKGVKNFILIKKGIAVLLVPILIVLSIYSFMSWVLEIRDFNLRLISQVTDINEVFYHEFFTLLVLVDVTLLLISLFFTTHYSLLIRNAGFVVSTILIRLSFTFDGWQNTLLIVVGVIFGVVIQGLYNMIALQEKESTMPTAQI